MSMFVGLALNDDGVGRIEFHKDDADRLDKLLGGFRLDMSAPLFRAYGRSTTAVSDVSAYDDSEPGILGRVKDAMRQAGFDVGVM